MAMTYDIGTVKADYRAGRTTPTEVLAELEARRTLWEAETKAFLHLSASADEEASASTARHAANRPKGALDGIFMGIKDLADVEGMPTTGGSDAYHWVAPADAPVVRAWREAGAIMVGKTNTQELAFGVVTAPTRNPWDLTRIPGGSSGGSAAALAAGMILGALGTDTGGSIRIPASCCGVVGHKPTYGIVPKRGIIPLGTSLDHAGPMAHTVDGCRRLLREIILHDPKDPSSLRFVPSDRRPTRRLGVPVGYFDSCAVPEVRAAFDEAVAFFAAAGYSLEEVEMAPWSVWKDLQLTIRLPEAYLYHRPVLEGERRARLGGDLAQRLDPGKDLSALTYVEARERQFALGQHMDEVMARFDAWLLPTLPVTAPPAGEDELSLPEGPSTVWEALIRLTAPFSTVGLPAVSVPCGFDEGGRPIGLQMVGARFDDFGLLDLAEFFEARHGYGGQVAQRR